MNTKYTSIEQDQYYFEIETIIKNTIGSTNKYLFEIKKRQYLIDFINYMTPLLQSNFYKLKTKIYWVLNRLVDFPKCKECGKSLSNKNVKNVFFGYFEYCSHQCSRNHETYNKVSNTKLSKYGSSTYNNMDKTRQTNLDRYGVEYVLQSPKIKQKAKETCLQTYGVEYSSQAESVKVKARNTYKKNYIDNKENAKQLQLKREQNSLKKYGCKHPTQSPIVQQKIKNTCMRLYGCKNGGGSKQAQQKIQQTTLNHYGVTCNLTLIKHYRISKLNKRIFSILNANHIYFNSEFVIKDDDILRIYDIKFNNKILLEINGDFWHANPNKYKFNDILNIPHIGKCSAQEIWDRDLKKKQLAEKHGYTVFYLWESDIISMTNKQILEIILKHINI